MQLNLHLTINENESREEVAKALRHAGNEAADYLLCCAIEVDSEVFLNTVENGEASMTRSE